QRSRLSVGARILRSPPEVREEAGGFLAAAQEGADRDGGQQGHNAGPRRDAGASPEAVGVLFPRGLCPDLWPAARREAAPFRRLQRWR
ncbi:hypothetical protein KR018_004762, partial [Drosophila ironensis]